MLKELSKREKEIVLMIRKKAPKVTVKNNMIRWWQFRLWKYRKSQVSAIGLKEAIEIFLMVKDELSADISD